MITIGLHLNACIRVSQSLLSAGHGRVHLVGVPSIMSCVGPLLLLSIGSSHCLLLLFLLFYELKYLTTEQMIDCRVIIVGAQLARLEDYIIRHFFLHLQLHNCLLQFIELFRSNLHGLSPLTICVRLLNANVRLIPAAAPLGTILAIASGTDTHKLLYPIQIHKNITTINCILLYNTVIYQFDNQFGFLL